MMMEKYKSYEGDIEIVNQSGGELTTGNGILFKDVKTENIVL